MLRRVGFSLIDLIRGTTSVELLRQLESIQFESTMGLQQRQKQLLDDYFDAIRTALPLYAGYRSFEELPIIDKDFANRNRDQLTNSHYRGRRVRKKTGGSTGEPLVFYTGTQSQSYLWAGILLSWCAAGYRLGEPVAFLAGLSLFGTGFKENAYYKLMNARLFSAFELSDACLQAYAREISSGGFRLIYGYAGAIYRLAQHVIASPTRPRFVLRGVVCTAEVLTPMMRQVIETAFDAPCFNQYGCHDAGISAYECERRQGLHLITTRCYHEVLEGGKLISTDLSNRVFFLARYDTGDLVMMEDKPCPCGRGFPLIGEVTGRSNDLVSDPEGNGVHFMFFNYLFREDSRISAFQVLYDCHKLVINIHCRETGNDWSSYLEQTRSSLKFNQIAFVENFSFILSARGKHRFVVRVDDVDAVLAGTERKH
jgi:phenylacetate-CoA ligase